LRRSQLVVRFCCAQLGNLGVDLLHLLLHLRCEGVATGSSSESESVRAGKRDEKRRKGGRTGHSSRRPRRQSPARARGSTGGASDLARASAGGPHVSYGSRRTTRACRVHPQGGQAHDPLGAERRTVPTHRPHPLALPPLDPLDDPPQIVPRPLVAELRHEQARLLLELDEAAEPDLERLREFGLRRRADRLARARREGIRCGCGCVGGGGGGGRRGVGGGGGERVGGRERGWRAGEEGRQGRVELGLEGAAGLEQTGVGSEGGEEGWRRRGRESRGVERDGHGRRGGAQKARGRSEGRGLEARRRCLLCCGRKERRVSLAARSEVGVCPADDGEERSEKGVPPSHPATASSPAGTFDSLPAVEAVARPAGPARLARQAASRPDLARRLLPIVRVPSCRPAALRDPCEKYSEKSGRDYTHLEQWRMLERSRGEGEAMKSQWRGQGRWGTDERGGP